MELEIYKPKRKYQIATYLTKEDSEFIKKFAKKNEITLAEATRVLLRAAINEIKK